MRSLTRACAQFILEAAPIFFGYTIFGTVAFGSVAYRFGTVAHTALTLFAILNGDVLRETFLSLVLQHSVPLYVSATYLFSFLLLFMYVVLKVVLAVVEDALAMHSVQQLDEEAERAVLEAPEEWEASERDGARGGDAASSALASSSAGVEMASPVTAMLQSDSVPLSAAGSPDSPPAMPQRPAGRF